tara:strand:- start:338 stop:799 length:462 start_codon:yes stop_codon:yes gene_type:complete
MKIENGKIVKLAVVNHLSGEIWGTYEQEGLYPDDFSYPALRASLLGKSPEENGSVPSDYLTELMHSPDFVFQLPIQNFRGVAELTVGMIFKTQIQMKKFSGRITALDDKFVTIDCNHPYQGSSDSHVGFIVQNVRDPSEKELNGGFKSTLIML